MSGSARRRLALTLAALSLAGIAPAQTPSIAVAREIDAQVWIPMMAASNSFDAEAFLGVLSRDLVRVSVDRNEVYADGSGRIARRERAIDSLRRESSVKEHTNMRLIGRMASSRLALGRDAGRMVIRDRQPATEHRLEHVAVNAAVLVEGAARAKTVTVFGSTRENDERRASP